MRRSQSNYAVAILTIALSLVIGFINPSFASDAKRQSVPETEPVIGGLVPCTFAAQLDCIEKLVVEHADGTFEEAKLVEAIQENLPGYQGQINQPSKLFFEFRGGKKSGPLHRVGVYSTLQTPTYLPDATGWGVQQGKRWGVLWILLDRVLLPTDPPFSKVDCDGVTISTCLLTPAFDPGDVFHLYARTSWLKPVGSGGSAANYQLNYKKITGGTLWRFTGSEHLSAAFADQKNLTESVKPGNEGMKTDFFNPTLYFVVDHAGKDLSESFWDPSCADKGFTATMINAPLAGQPYWDYQKETLVFNIYGPHLTPLGTLNKGFFQVIFHKAWLDCRFPGNTLSTAAELKVSILDQAGSPQVAVTNIKMQKEVVEIYASGFHYSSPRVEVARKSSKNSSDSVKSVGYSDNWQELIQPKNVSITCVKGKTRKTVTALKPVCPSGYKKVSKP
ncbi:MAG: hypothetical protein ACKOPU_06040 [Candidatus Planktophila sp.]